MMSLLLVVVLRLALGMLLAMVLSLEAMVLLLGLSLMLDHRLKSGSAFGERLFDEFIAVKPLAFQRNVKVACAHVSRVGGDSGKCRVFFER